MCCSLYALAITHTHSTADCDLFTPACRVISSTNQALMKSLQADGAAAAEKLRASQSDNKELSVKLAAANADVAMLKVCRGQSFVTVITTNKHVGEL